MAQREVFTIVVDPEHQAVGIRCGTCARTSWNARDVLNQYCGACHVFHKDTIAAALSGPVPPPTGGR